MAKTIAEYVALAEHYKAIGDTDIHLMRDDDAPWELATECKSGGLYRMDVCTSAYFNAVHESGLTFSWSFDFEDWSSDGSGYYQFKIDTILGVLARLSEPVAEQFRGVLGSAVESIEKRGKELLDAAQKCFGQASSIKAVL